LRGISFSGFVEVIEGGVFNWCIKLESCPIAENGHYVTIEGEAISECCLLQSFYVLANGSVLGEECFKKFGSLHRLKFTSGESFKKLVGEYRIHGAGRDLGFVEKRIGRSRNGLWVLRMVIIYLVLSL
jgi:hypothetical protein